MVVPLQAVQVKDQGENTITALFLDLSTFAHRFYMGLLARVESTKTYHPSIAHQVSQLYQQELGFLVSFAANCVSVLYFRPFLKQRKVLSNICPD